MRYRLIGDIHGYYKRWKTSIKDCERSRALGDVGIGFFKNDRDFNKIPMVNPPHAALMKGDHKTIRGNHDNLSVCKKQTYWIPDGTIEDTGTNKIMYVGGAFSTDRYKRNEGFDWWEDEELSIQELDKVVDLYNDIRPSVMITHDCPESICSIICTLSGRRKIDYPSRTRQAFQIMFETHQPSLWIFGHHHYSWTEEINGTTFKCLNELEAFDIDL